MTHRASPHDGIPSCETQNIMSRRLVSLMDFSKLVEAFDRNGVTFVSVTRSFNTTSTGRSDPFYVKRRSPEGG
jgi:hypothetical protein